ncbi:MAG: hypothetical protein ABI145_17955 [Steroidobacteraceae bacterium]
MVHFHHTKKLNAGFHRGTIAFFLATMLCSESCIGIAAKERAWPSFLPAPSQVPNADIVKDVWENVTFEREVAAPLLNTPMPVYESIIDAPDILAAAANHLGLTEESAELAPDDGFELHGTDGSAAWYRVLLYEPQHRVILSRGTLVVSGFRVKADVLGELKISSSNELIRQNLKIFVHIKDPFLSSFAHFVFLFLPTIADQELSRGFRLTHAVTTWAASDPDGFCLWLSSRPFTVRTRRVEHAVNCLAKEKVR